MEKNKNISLDELFARAKGEEPVISQEDVRAITSSATSPVQSIQQTTSIISRKGFIMTGLGLVGASAVLVGYLSMGSGQSPVGSGQVGMPSTQHAALNTVGNGKTETVTPTNEPKKEVKVTKKMIIVRDNGDDAELAIDENVPEPPIPPIPPLMPDGKLMAPVEVEKVGIIQAKEEDLAKLGVKKLPNGEIRFKSGTEGKTAIMISIPFKNKGWGVVTSTETSDEVEEMPVLSATVITDTRGNKRYMHFSDGNSMVHMEKYEGDVLDDMHSNDEHISTNDKDIVIREGTVNTKKVIRGKKTISNEIMVDQDSSHTVSSMFVVDSVDKKNTKGVVVKVDLDNDESMPSDHNFDIKIGDSSIRINELVRDAMAKAKVALKDMKMNMDSAHKAMVKVQLDKNIQWNGEFPGFDSAMKNLKKQMSSIMVIDQNFTPDEAAKLDKGVMIDMPDINGAMQEMGVKITAKINSLIPVLVRKATDVTHNAHENRDYDNGVIMWFEPEQFWKQYEGSNSAYEVAVNGNLKVEGPLANSVGTKQSAKNPTSSSASVVSNTMVYPNPVRSMKTNIHYKLSEPRSVAFSIHDILGKKMLDCGSLAERTAGEYDFELNIGNIPAGIYLVVITTDKGEQTIQRIAVEK